MQGTLGVQFAQAGDRSSGRGHAGGDAAPATVLRNKRRRLRRSAGFSMIEVLITVFVTSVGMLSVAGLQTISKKVNYDAVQRTTATALAQSIVQHMRANPAQRAAYVTDDATAISQNVDCSGTVSGCSAAQVATHDLYVWGQLLRGVEVTDSGGAAAGGLVAPTGCISLDPDSGSYIVTVAWRGVSALAPPDSSAPADDPERSSCGADKADYDDPDSSGSDHRMRRVLVLRTFFTDPYAL